MPELRVMAVSTDGTRLVLKAADGSEYTLPIDDRLRAAVRGDRARLGQIEIEMDSQLRPRDIQARIRAGATAEEVAQLAGIPVDRVRRFEGPVLAERAFMAERAQNTPVRRHGETAGPPLGEVVGERLMARRAEPDSVRWDSWRRDDGAWEVLLVFRAESETHSATWTFDPPRRLVSPADDEAQRLIGEEIAPEPTFPFVPRIARLPQEEDSLGALLDVVPSLRQEPRGDSRRAPEPRPEPLHTDLRPDPLRTDPLREDRRAEEPAEVPAAGIAGAGSAYEAALIPRVAAPHRDRLTGTTDRQAEADGVRPGRRATVPSWDDIVFGSRRKKRD